MSLLLLHAALQRVGHQNSQVCCERATRRAVLLLCRLAVTAVISYRIRNHKGADARALVPPAPPFASSSSPHRMLLAAYLSAAAPHRQDPWPALKGRRFIIYSPYLRLLKAIS